MESVSSAERSIAISDSIYEELSPEIQTGLKRVEAKDAFYEGLTRLKTVEISIEILKNGEVRTVTKELYQHEWSWAKFGFSCILAPIGPIIYQQCHYISSTYSREKAENLIKRSIKELALEEELSPEEIVQCAIKVNTADSKFFSQGYWLNFVDKQETLCDHTFRKVG